MFGKITSKQLKRQLEGKKIIIKNKPPSQNNQNNQNNKPPTIKTIKLKAPKEESAFKVIPLTNRYTKRIIRK